MAITASPVGSPTSLTAARTAASARWVRAASVDATSARPSTSAARADWPEFRGPWGDGHASAPGDTKLIGFPLHWSETNNIKWKTEIPFRGWSTPVVMAGQVWLTTATDDGHDFFAICVDAASGKIRFNEKVFHSDNPEPLGNGASMNCYATPSPVDRKSTRLNSS